jgi:catechol 2,3-dioxygenase-like lactoylglutathione lyase family enzyme
MAGMSDDQERLGAPVEWWAMTIDCLEPQVMADFYVALLGGRVTRRIDGEVNVEAGGMLLNFRATPGYRPPTWPSSEVPLHSHFDFVVEDPDAVAAQMVAMGGRYADHQDPDDPHFVVMLDPAGHPFCLLRSSVARPF